MQKIILSFNEINHISSTTFEYLTGAPLANSLPEFKHADQYNILIRGWVDYWNNIFNHSPHKTTDLLDPNLIKALIATESSFDVNSHKSKAYGLMQLMDTTFAILQNHHGELNNYLIFIPEHKFLDPSANICAGVRWLFRKKITASTKLGRNASWIEAVADYKGYLNDMISKKLTHPKGMENLHKYYGQIKQHLHPSAILESFNNQ